MDFVQSPRSGGFGFSAPAVVAGLALIPLAVLMLSSSRTLPALTARLGIRRVLTAGCLVAALGCGFFAVFHGALWQAFVMTGVLGAGLGATFAAIPGVIVRAVPAGEAGSATGFYQVARFAGLLPDAEDDRGGDIGDERGETGITGTGSLDDGHGCPVTGISAQAEASTCAGLLDCQRCHVIHVIRVGQRDGRSQDCQSIRPTVVWRTSRSQP